MFRFHVQQLVLSVRAGAPVSSTSGVDGGFPDGDADW